MPPEFAAIMSYDHYNMLMGAAGIASGLVVWIIFSKGL